MTRIFDPSGALTNTPPYNGDSTTDQPDVAIVRRMEDIDTHGAHKIIAAIRSGKHEDGLETATLAQVAEALQRFGTLGEVAVTDDDVIVGTATRRPRKEDVAIWTGYAIGNWHPSDIWTQGLGGSETAAWRLAEELAEKGYAVTLYGDFGVDSVFGDVILRDFRTYDPTKYVGRFVSFRNARIFDGYRPNAKTTILWLEDLAGAHSEGLTPGNAANIDRICTVSSWHKQHMLDAYPWLTADHILACRNGVDLSFFARDDLVREKRVVYSSSPDRGLAVLLELWPRVLEAVPDAQLISTYSRWYDLVADGNPAVAANRARILSLIDQPGVSRVSGGMGQKALAELLLSSMVWAHPSWETIHDVPMWETSCIASMEAQAAGCVCVAGAHGALTETLQVGTLVDGSPHEEQWRDVFVQSLIAGLTNETTQRAAQVAGPDAMRGMGWFGAADLLESVWWQP